MENYIPENPAFHARYTCLGQLQQDIVDFITRNATKYIIAREVATREHIQVYLEYENTKKTWDNKFKSKFKSMDRRDKYFMPDKGTTMLYVCKDNDIIAKRGFSDEDIQNLHTQYHQNNPKTRISLEITESLELPPETKQEKTKKPRPPTFMAKCRQELEEEYPFLNWQKKHKKIVFLKVMTNLGQGCKNLDHIVVTRMVYGVLNSLIKDKKEWHEYWYQKCFGEDINEAPELSEEDDKKLDEEDDFATAYIKQIQEENERELNEISERLKKDFFNKK